MIITLTDFKVDSSRAGSDIDSRAGALAAESQGIPAASVRDFRITGKSIDARRTPPLLLYSLTLDVDRNDAPANLHVLPELRLPATALPLHPVVVGTGPAGIFAALALALAGCKPLVLDRGRKVEERYADYRCFLETRELDEESNLLIGEGGAGTFSDGKLYTGRRDELAAFVLHTFTEMGAPAEIRYLKRPHIGSDRLRLVALNLRKRIEALGGIFRFGTEVKELLIENGVCRGVVTASGERIEAPRVYLAPGLGGRALLRRVIGQAVPYECKPFQIGCRIEHPQSFIDRRMYHLDKRPVALGAAEYHLLARGKENVASVSSFCMCPGGTLLNATAWKNRSLTNGMSDYARNGEFANGCLIATLPADRFPSPETAWGFLDQLEYKLFELGGSDYTLPAQDAAAFLDGKNQLNLRRSSAATGIVPGRIDQLIPTELAAALRMALRHFDRLHPGFIDQGKFVGVESCVSSPVRLLRNEHRESPVKNLYPIGEGCGCAGGIMSAALDGLRSVLLPAAAGERESASLL